VSARGQINLVVLADLFGTKAIAYFLWRFTFAHRAFAAREIFRLADALILRRFFFGVAVVAALAGEPKI
jgi:hypothetical protein